MSACLCYPIPMLHSSIIWEISSRSQISLFMIVFLFYLDFLHVTPHFDFQNIECFSLLNLQYHLVTLPITQARAALSTGFCKEGSDNKGQNPNYWQTISKKRVEIYVTTLHRSFTVSCQYICKIIREDVSINSYQNSHLSYYSLSNISINHSYVKSTSSNFFCILFSGVYQLVAYQSNSTTPKNS